MDMVTRRGGLLVASTNCNEASPEQTKQTNGFSLPSRLSPVSPKLELKRERTLSWGRRQNHGTWKHSLGCLGVMTLCPTLVMYYWISLTYFGGSILDTAISIWESGPRLFIHMTTPRPDLQVSLWYFGWVVFQAVLFRFLPARVSMGQLTPAGHRLEYHTNGLLAWIITHGLFLGLVLARWLDPAIIAKNWEQLLVVANFTGFLVTGLAYIKALLWPTYENDSKFSGSRMYDIYMGVELNPRIGKYFDLKLFTNGRPGIVAWTLIDFSFVALQYQTHGYITKSIVIATLLHTVYVVDFFLNEDWYVRTIDICHDHFGFYLAWGCYVWLPTMYTLQTQYLAEVPVALSDRAAIAITLVGLSGYVLFRSVNHQKDIVRRTNGKCQIWGSPAKVLRLKYTTVDGLEHESVLLYSGWWGQARHINYLGDLALSYAMCATCGLGHLLPWTYAIFMTILLIHRCWRDEERCSQKYGKGWEEYCKKVKWVILPGVY